MTSRTESPATGRRSNLLRAAGLAALLAVCGLFLYFEALKAGFVLVTLALCAFFVVVALDIGIDRDAPFAAPEAEAMPESEPVAARGRAGRTSRTA